MTMEIIVAMIMMIDDDNNDDSNYNGSNSDNDRGNNSNNDDEVTLALSLASCWLPSAISTSSSGDFEKYHNRDHDYDDNYHSASFIQACY